MRTLTIAIEQSPCSIVVTDVNAKLQYVNPRFTQVTGYSEEEALGKNPRILHSGLTPRQTFDELWKTLVQGNMHIFIISSHLITNSIRQKCLIHLVLYDFDSVCKFKFFNILLMFPHVFHLLR